MNQRLELPIGILDEHPDWSARLIGELTRRGLPWEKIDHSSHVFDPRDRRPAYSVIVNRSSPSSHTRGHASVLFYTEALLAHAESLGIPVINPVAAYRFEKSKALQLGLFEQLGIRYPRTVVVNHRDQVLKALDAVRFPACRQAERWGLGRGHRPVRDAGRACRRARHVAVRSRRDRAGAGVHRVRGRGGRARRSAGRSIPLRDSHRAPGRRGLQPLPGGHLPDITGADPPDLGACPVEAKPGPRRESLRRARRSHRHGDSRSRAPRRSTWAAWSTW